MEAVATKTENGVEGIDWALSTDSGCAGGQEHAHGLPTFAARKPIFIRSNLWWQIPGDRGRLILDELKTYAAAHREVCPSVEHRTIQYENNRAEVSHQLTREQERQMRGFKSIEQAQQFLSLHGPVQNLFRVGRTHLRAAHQRLLRDRVFADWRETTYVC